MSEENINSYLDEILFMARENGTVRLNFGSLYSEKFISYIENEYDNSTDEYGLFAYYEVSPTMDEPGADYGHILDFSSMKELLRSLYFKRTIKIVY